VGKKKQRKRGTFKLPGEDKGVTLRKRMERTLKDTKHRKTRKKGRENQNITRRRERENTSEDTKGEGGKRTENHQQKSQEGKGIGEKEKNL